MPRILPQCELRHISRRRVFRFKRKAPNRFWRRAAARLPGCPSSGIGVFTGPATRAKSGPVPRCRLGGAKEGKPGTRTLRPLAAGWRFDPLRLKTDRPAGFKWRSFCPRTRGSRHLRGCLPVSAKRDRAGPKTRTDPKVPPRNTSGPPAAPHYQGGSTWQQPCRALGVRLRVRDEWNRSKKRLRPR
jgi:hypothetical protein